MAQLKPVDGTDVYLWRYLPSFTAAAIFMGLFAVVTLAHCWRMTKTRTWYCSIFALGGLFQITGYGVRILAHYHTNQIAPYVVQSIFILLAPVFYAASIYTVLGRLIRSVHGDRFSIVRPARMTKLFVLGDWLSLMVQGNAAGLTSKEKTRKMGEIIITAGLFIQVIVFGFFIVAAVAFHKRMRRDLTKRSEVRPEIPWRQGLYMIYACSILIMFRSIFRIVEYITGTDAYLLSHEWPMYTFDAAPMWAVQLIFLVWFPHHFKVPQGEDTEMYSELRSETRNDGSN